MDANRWRDVVYVLVSFPLAILELSVASDAVAHGDRAPGDAAPAGRLGSLGRPPVDRGIPTAPHLDGRRGRCSSGSSSCPVAASVSRGMIALHRAVVEGLLCVDPTVALRQDVERLRGSRSAALELEASELRRIERDLHDGAQARLVCPGDRPGPGRGPHRDRSRVREDARRRRPRAGTPGARGAARPRPRDRAGDPPRSRARGRARVGRRREPAADGPREHPRPGRAAARLRSSGRPTSWSPSRWPTSPSTPRRAAAW